MKNILFALSLLTLTGCVSMTPAGASVRVVDGDNADFVVECDFIRGMNVSTGFAFAPSSADHVMLARNAAAEEGADTIVLIGYGGGDVLFDMYRCK